MEEKIIKTFTKYAQKDNISLLALGFFDLKKKKIIKHLIKEGTQNTDNGILFETGSITKTFTASVYGLLQNEIDTSKSVKHYLGSEINKIFEELTIKELLVHQSGLPRLPISFILKMDKENPYSSLTKDDLYEYLENPTEISNTKKYSYSNLGYGILGEILEKLFNKDYLSVISEMILTPLKMGSTTTLTNSLNRDCIAKGYDSKNNEVSYWDNEVLSGAGCLLSNIDDMLEYLINNTAIAMESNINLSKVNSNLLSKSMSYGWHIKNGIFSKLLGYNNYYWHNGMTGGFSSYACFNKEKQNGLILMANKAVLLDSYFYNFISHF